MEFHAKIYSSFHKVTSKCQSHDQMADLNEIDRISGLKIVNIMIWADVWEVEIIDRKLDSSSSML